MHLLSDFYGFRPTVLGLKYKVGASLKCTMQAMKTLTIRLRIACRTWGRLGVREQVAMTLWVLGSTDLAERVMRR